MGPIASQSKTIGDQGIQIHQLDSQQRWTGHAAYCYLWIFAPNAILESLALKVGLGGEVSHTVGAYASNPIQTGSIPNDRSHLASPNTQRIQVPIALKIMPGQCGVRQA